MSARSSLLPAIAMAFLGAIGIALVQPSLASSTRKVRQRDDVFLLPPPVLSKENE